MSAVERSGALARRRSSTGGAVSICLGRSCLLSGSMHAALRTRRRRGDTATRNRSNAVLGVKDLVVHVCAEHRPAVRAAPSRWLEAWIQWAAACVCPAWRVGSSSTRCVAVPVASIVGKGASSGQTEQRLWRQNRRRLAPRVRGLARRRDEALMMLMLMLRDSPSDGWIRTDARPWER
eukprot:6192161-Pleurochrysis_carterae.AAC.1